MKVFILLGAGASLPYIPGTRDFTRALRAWNVYREPPKDSRAVESVWTEIMGSGAKGLPYFEALYQHSQNFFRQPESHLHFERLIQLSSQLDTFTRFEKAVDEFQPLVGSFMRFNEAVAHFDRPSLNSIISSDACVYLLDWLSDQFDGVLETKLRNSSLNQFLREIEARKQKARLFSLNYDTLPIYSGLSFATGFEDQPGMTYQVFSPMRYLDEVADHLYSQLHGSILFGFPKESLREAAPPGRVGRYASAAEAKKNRKMKTGGGRRQDNSSSGTNLMITGLRKADDILSEPYASYFHRMFQELVEADAWIIAGYGGGDTHINHLLKRAQYLKRQRCRHLKIAWIGYAHDDDFYGDDASMFEPGMDLYEKNSDALESFISHELWKMLRDGRSHHGTYYWVKRKEVQKFTGRDSSILLSFRGTEDTFREHSDEIFQFLA